MTAAVFVWPLVACLGVVAWLIVPTALERRRARTFAPRAHRGTVVAPPPPSYAKAVIDALPQAWASSGLRETPSKPFPKVTGAARPLGDGISLPIRTVYAMRELVKLEERVAAGLAGRVPVGLVRVRSTPGEPGRAELIVSRTHPLASQLPYPVMPGQRPWGGRGLQVTVGQTEFLKPLTVDLQKTALWAGQNGSGKTWGVIDMMLAASTFPNVEMTVYDASIKGGSGYSPFGPRLRHGGVLKGRRAIFADIALVEQSLAARAKLLDGAPYAPTRKLPLRLIIIEEFPGLIAEDEDLETIIRLAQQGREFGLSLQLVAQSAHGTIIDTVLRAELRQRFVFRMAGWREADMALGEGVRGGDGEDGWQPIPDAWPGVLDSVVPEETGIVRSRCFAPIASLADAQRMFGSSVDWADPKAVPNARMRSFVQQHVDALTFPNGAPLSAPRAVDLPVPAQKKPAPKKKVS